MKIRVFLFFVFIALGCGSDESAVETPVVTENPTISYEGDRIIVFFHRIPHNIEVKVHYHGGLLHTGFHYPTP